MSLTASALRASRGGPLNTARGLDTAQVQALCAVLAFIGLGYALMRSGGRERGVTELAISLAIPSLLAGRVWRTVPLFELGLSACVALAVTILPLVTPLGVSHAADLDAYLYAVVLYLAVRGFARDVERRRIVALAVLSLGIIESLDVIHVWIGEHDPTFQVVGTFYWHNQFGAFAAAIALLSSAMVMRSRRAEDATAWLVAPLFLALTWLSHSRASALAFVLAAVFLPGLAIVRKQWWPLARVVCALALAVAVHALLVAVVSSSGTGGGQGFSPAKDSLASTSAFRLTAGVEAMRVFGRDPLLSRGYGSLGVTGWQHAAPGTTTSPYAHSSEAQALSDGGLLLGIPVILAIALLAWLAIRYGLRSARRDVAPGWLGVGASLATLAMLLHGSIDFDTQYPVLAALPGVLIALTAPAYAKAVTSKRLRLQRLAFSATVAATVLGALLVASYWQTTQRLSTATAALNSDSAHSVALARLALTDHHFTDVRPAVFIVQAADLGYIFDETTLERALRASRSYGQLDRSFAPVWARVNAEVLAESPPTGPTTTHH